MAKFKVGDRVRLTDTVYGDSEAGDLGTVTEVPDYSGFYAKLDGRRKGAQGNGVHWVGWRGAELVEPDIAVGDKVLVAYEGIISFVDNGGYEVTHEYENYWAPKDQVTLVSKAEPEYEPGQLYRDADEQLFYRTDSNMWRWLRSDGSGPVMAYPALPLTKVTVS